MQLLPGMYLACSPGTFQGEAACMHGWIRLTRPPRLHRREQYGPLGGSRTVIHGNFTKPPRETADSLSSPERHATAGLLATQITRAPLLHKLPTAGQQVTLGRQLVMTELINALPPPDLGDFLVHECKSMRERRIRRLASGPTIYT